MQPAAHRSPLAAWRRVQVGRRFRFSSFLDLSSCDSLMNRQRGYTFVEIAVVAAIVAVLASAALPLASVTMKRTREIELRRNLREIRTAIDKFKDAADQK